MDSYTWSVARWRQSTAYKTFTLEERCVYRELLDSLALHNGELPDNEAVLAEAARCTAHEWRRVRRRVLARLRLTGGVWRSPTMDTMIGPALRQRNYRDRKRASNG